MDLGATLNAQLRHLYGSVGFDETGTAAGVGELARQLTLAVPSYLGLQLVLVEHGHLVTLTEFDPTVGPTDIRASVRLPLVALGVEGAHPTSEVSFYAGVPGAFVDLAADVAYVLQVPTREAGPVSSSLEKTRPVIVLDDPVQPTTVLSGLEGAAELSTVNRAIGVLMGQGHPTLEAARAELVRLAAVGGLSVLAVATQLIRSRAR